MVGGCSGSISLHVVGSFEGHRGMAEIRIVIITSAASSSGQSTLGTTRFSTKKGKEDGPNAEYLSIGEIKMLGGKGSASMLLRPTPQLLAQGYRHVPHAMPSRMESNCSGRQNGGHYVQSFCGGLQLGQR